MAEPGFASLGPSLLARKGGAKPAMRPQVAPLAESHVDAAEDQLEDLGWNDMGDHEPGLGGDVVPINAGMGVGAYGDDEDPVVHRQQRRLEQRLLADAVMTGPEDNEPEYDEEAEADYGADFDDGESAEIESVEAVSAAPVVASASIRPAAAAARPRVPAARSGRRAAFTLRLDTDRHLKLRLAATMQGVSAQVLVTEALDRLLAEYDELEVIATHLKRH